MLLAYGNATWRRTSKLRALVPKSGHQCLRVCLLGVALALCGQLERIVVSTRCLCSLELIEPLADGRPAQRQAFVALARISPLPASASLGTLLRPPRLARDVVSLVSRSLGLRPVLIGSLHVH